MSLKYSRQFPLNPNTFHYVDSRSHVRNLLRQSHSKFRLPRSSKLVFMDEYETVAIELLRGGSTRQPKLPISSY
jgi:hypothetical protein